VALVLSIVISLVVGLIVGWFLHVWFGPKPSAGTPVAAVPATEPEAPATESEAPADEAEAAAAGADTVDEVVVIDEVIAVVDPVEDVVIIEEVVTVIAGTEPETEPETEHVTEAETEPEAEAPAEPVVPAAEPEPVAVFETEVVEVVPAEDEPVAAEPEPVAAAEVEVENAQVDAVVIPAQAGPADAVDNLQRIEGIGPKMMKALNAAGISTFEQLAATDETALRAAITAAGMRFSPTLISWPGKARVLADAQNPGALNGKLVSDPAAG
jgi:predicted flap endonuclease-1-like 5' DNA nuclease